MSYFSTNLREKTKNQVLFLTGLDTLGITANQPTTKSLHRYVKLWLPLVNTHEQTKLIPPPDVAWLWHCHRLAPTQYESYVCLTHGHLLDPPRSFSFQTPTDVLGGAFDEAKATRDIWETTYSDEPFFYSPSPKKDGKVSAKAEQTTEFQALSAGLSRQILEGFDLIAATQAQSKFWREISGPDLLDESFLRGGVDMYYKFLNLMKFSTDDRPLIPTKQVDLIWHTHILVSIRRYNQDCIQICGQKIYHDDSYGKNEGKGSDLDIAFRRTKSLWREYYGEPYRTVMGVSNGSSNISKGRSSTMQAAFIPAEHGRFSKKFESNPFRKNYAFGFASQGWGYYSLKTKEGWEVLSNRLHLNELEVQQVLDTYECSIFCCKFWREPNATEMERYEDLSNQLLHLRRQRADVKRRLDDFDNRRGADDPMKVSDAALHASAKCGGSGMNKYQWTDGTLHVRNDNYKSGGKFIFAFSGCGGGGGGG